MTDPIEFLREDPALVPLVEAHGPVELTPHPKPFERLVVSIINQQLSTASATAIRERVFDRFEVTPAGILAADGSALRSTGLSRQKIDYLRSAATAFENGQLSPGRFETMSDQAVIDTMTEVRGIGVWTAKMYLMFVLAREDVFPIEDLGIRRGMEALFGDDIDRTSMVERAEAWAPYRSYASRYLWRLSD